jgi:hypothetical protein
MTETVKATVDRDGGTLVLYMNVTKVGDKYTAEYFTPSGVLVRRHSVSRMTVIANAAGAVK